jgi:hypothetical protein
MNSLNNVATNFLASPPTVTLAPCLTNVKLHFFAFIDFFKVTAPIMTVVDSRTPFDRADSTPIAPPERKTTYELPSIYAPAPKSDQIPSDRSARNIAYLCAKIAEELRKRPQTRDELSLSTGFARQRICTVISVFKAIGLVNVKDSNTRRVSFVDVIKMLIFSLKLNGMNNKQRCCHQLALM